MSAIPTVNQGYVAPTPPAGIASNQGSSETGNTSQTDSSTVKISATGRALAASSSGKTNSQDDDIDDSNLPDSIKTSLKQIRKLQAEIRRLQQEMAEVQANKSLSEDERMMRVHNLQLSISVLSGALMSAQRTLQKLMKAESLSTEQSLKVASIISTGSTGKS